LRRASLTELPQTFIGVGSINLLADEDYQLHDAPWRSDEASLGVWRLSRR
jgi:hypothetical protein